MAEATPCDKVSMVKFNSLFEGREPLPAGRRIEFVA